MLMDPAGRSPLAVPRLGRRPLHGTVALIDRASISVAELAIGPRGVSVRRHVLAFNGMADMKFLDSDPASVVAALARVLRENGLQNKLACVGLFESMFGATLCELPPTTPAAAAALLERRVREQVIDGKEDLLADHASVEARKSPAATKQHALLAWASRAQLERFAAAFKREGLVVRRIVPPSVALLDLFGRTRPADADRLELFARYCYPSLVIGVHRGGRPLYLRFLPDVMADADEGVVTTLISEVRRTAMFVTESHEGSALAAVTFSGLSVNDATRFTQRLAAEAGLQAQSQQVTLDGPDLGADPERLAALTGLLLHGAPLARQRVRAMNLLPGADRPLARTAGTLLALALVTMVAAFSSLGIARHSVKAGSTDVRMLEACLQSLQPTSDERRTLLEVSRRAQTNRATLDLLHTVAGNPVQPLLETLLLLPPGARAVEGRLNHAYAIGSEHPRLELLLRGDFSGPRAASADALQAGLRNRPWCAALTASRGSVQVSADHAGVVEDLALGMRLQ